MPLATIRLLQSIVVVAIIDRISILSLTRATTGAYPDGCEGRTERPEPHTDLGERVRSPHPGLHAHAKECPVVPAVDDYFRVMEDC